MKVIIAAFCLVAVALSEPPPSNSYLPPSAAGRAGGYPQGGPHNQGGHSAFGGPQVIAARSSDHGHGGNAFARGAGHDHGAQARFGAHDTQGHGAQRIGHDEHGHGAQARFGGHDDHEQGYDQNASPFARNGLDDVSGEPASYNFGYMVNDFQEGTDFGHHEERQDERTEGEYHVVLPDGRKQTVSYEADERGFKPHISYEDTDAVGRSNGGYDDNANNLHGNHGGAHGNHGNANARSNGY